jgi:hypothetical protein
LDDFIGYLTLIDIKMIKDSSDCLSGARVAQEVR